MGNDGIRVINNGGLIVVHLIDEWNNTYFTGRAKKNNKKDIKRLINELKEKGFKFPDHESDWFE